MPCAKVNVGSASAGSAGDLLAASRPSYPTGVAGAGPALPGPSHAGPPRSDNHGHVRDRWVV